MTLILDSQSRHPKEKVNTSSFYNLSMEKGAHEADPDIHPYNAYTETTSTTQSQAFI